MLSIIRKSSWFKESLNKKYNLITEKLNPDTKNVVLSLLKGSDEVEKLNLKYEDEMRALEMKYDKLIQAELKKQREEINNNPEKLPNFWLNALSNHKNFKEFIHSDDVEILVHLKEVAYEKLDKDNVRLF